MFTSIARLVTRHPRALIAVWIMLATFGFGVSLTNISGHGTLFDRMEATKSLVPGSESDDVLTISNAAAPDAVTAVVSAPLSDPDVLTRTLTLRGELSEVTGIESVAMPDPTGVNPDSLAFASTNGFAVVASLNADAETTEPRVLPVLRTYADDLAKISSDYAVHVTSALESNKAMMAQVQGDLVRGESIGLPVALLLMILVFGGIFAAALPLIGAVAAIGIAMGTMWTLTFAVSLDSFVLNVLTIIGLALSIDYGLLIVSRYREELARGFETCEALSRTITTAGRTVFFSAVTIAVSICGLFVMDVTVLRMVAAGGVTVVLLAVASAITFVPAVVQVAGGRLARPSFLARIPGFHALLSRTGDVTSDSGVFSRLAHRVHAHPWIFMTAITGVLVAMASPIGHLSMRTDVTEYLPKASEAGQAFQILQKDFPALAAPDVQLLARTTDPTTSASVAQWISSVEPDAKIVSIRTLDRTWTSFNIDVDAADPVGPEVTSIMTGLRDASTDAPVDVLVGGGAALQHDFERTALDGAPWALAIIISAVFVLLFLMTGSLIVPLKALIINSLSVVASLGLTSWIFTSGHLIVPAVSGLVAMVVVCAIAFGFGLAMDYEVFLLARIKENWDEGYSNDESVERGLQRSGRIITSAAAIIIAVFIGFVFGDSMPIKQIGVLLALTVAVDATLVRMLLVPSTMTLLGSWNWWAPRALTRLHKRFEIEH